MMRLVTLTAFLLFLLVVFQVDPDASGMVGKMFFYASLFLFLSGASIMVLFWVRRRTDASPQAIVAYLGTTFRQGIFFGVLLVGLLFLQGKGMLVWWSGLMVVGALFLLELYFLLKETK